MPSRGIEPRLTVDETVVLPLNYKGFLIRIQKGESKAMRRIELRYLKKLD
jgi:hypothetical protein